MGSHLPDELLARRAAAGHLQDFEELLRRYRNRVYRLCYRMAGNAEDAADWTQEAFVRVYRQLDRYDSSLPFVPWLLRVASNTCLNLLKARMRRQGKLELDLSERTQGIAVVADPMGSALSREEARLARAAIEALPPPLRQALVLRVVEELSYRELAEILEVPLQTAVSRVRRALTQVRDRLEQAAMEIDR